MKPDFSWTQWDAATIAARVPELLAKKRERYAVIKAVPPESRTFETTIRALEEANYDISDDIHRIALLMNVSPDAAIRESAQQALEQYDHEVIELEYDDELYAVVSTYAATYHAAQGAKKERLRDEEKKLLDDMIRDYRRMGFELPPAKRETLKVLLKELSRLELAFDKNINDYCDHITLTEDELEGLSEPFIASLARDSKGGYIVSLDAPELRPFVQTSKIAHKRQELIDKSLHKGGEENIKLLEQLLDLRAQKAKLLGYKNHAAYKTETRMAKTPEAVMDFLSDLSLRLKEGVQKDVAALTLLKREETGDPKAKLTYYDIPSPAASYYGTELKKLLYDVNDEEVRAYFPLEQVKRGTLTTYETLFGVRFVKEEGHALWHPDVEVYAVKEGRTTIAYFMLDLYPREGKYGHAAVFGVVSGRERSVKSGATRGTAYTPPLAAMVTNFPKPSKGSPSLMLHRDVETFFHEFGHIVHQVLTRAPYASQSGTSVARDFVEAPSQMLENWVWQRETLKQLSGHYQNPKEKIPDKLIDRLIVAKQHLAPYHYMRQLVLAWFDMTIHTKRPKKGVKVSINDVYNTIAKKLLGVPMPEGNIFSASFGHLTGYDAGYYGYLWSEVFAADMFTRFEK